MMKTDPQLTMLDQRDLCDVHVEQSDGRPARHVVTLVVETPRHQGQQPGRVEQTET